MRHLLWLILFNLIFVSVLHSQNVNEQPLRISGQAIDAETQMGLNGLMVINKRTGTGSFGNYAGEFSVTVFRTDTLRFSVVGFQTIDICFKDSSVIQSQFKIVLEMHKLQIDLEGVDIFPSREFSEIKKDIDKLKLDQQPGLKGADAAFSPVTYLYERFSRFEKQKRKAAGLYHQDAINDLLKELFRKYVRADIIDLSEKEFDEFLIFCPLPEQFIKTASQYDLIMGVKYCYEKYLEKKKQ
jgi:hypothetical protein